MYLYHYHFQALVSIIVIVAIVCFIIYFMYIQGIRKKTIFMMWIVRKTNACKKPFCTVQNALDTHIS